MRIISLTADGYRNLSVPKLRPEEGVNIFYGDNAQGKTNLLEAVWLFTGGRSFRGAKDRELVGFSRTDARLSLRFFAEEREQQAAITVAGRRQAELNGIPQRTPAALAGHFCAVVFSPAHLTLVKDGPEARRRFIDAAYCPLRPAYVRTMTEYVPALAQRNALLRSGYADAALLAPWDEQVAALGARVTAARRAYVRRLAPAASAIYRGLSGDKEELSVGYDSPLPETDTAAVAAALYDALTAHRGDDLAAGFTTCGPHRDDLSLAINGLSARRFGSQGQQRSVVLALKLAEAAILREVTGEPPVVLLDDVMSELDPSRQDYILNHLTGWQVFITCCDPAAIVRSTGGAAFKVSAGTIESGEGSL